MYPETNKKKKISITKFHPYVLIGIFLPQLFILIFITHHRKNHIFRDILTRKKTKQQLGIAILIWGTLIIDLLTAFMMLVFKTVLLIFLLSLQQLRWEQESKSWSWGDEGVREWIKHKFVFKQQLIKDREKWM